MNKERLVVELGKEIEAKKATIRELAGYVAGLERVVVLLESDEKSAPGVDPGATIME